MPCRVSFDFYTGDSGVVVPVHFNDSVGWDPPAAQTVSNAQSCDDGKFFILEITDRLIFKMIVMADIVSFSLQKGSMGISPADW